MATRKNFVPAWGVACGLGLGWSCECRCSPQLATLIDRGLGLQDLILRKDKGKGGAAHKPGKDQGKAVQKDQPKTKVRTNKAAFLLC